VLLEWASHALHAVLAVHSTWQYRRQADRWRVAAACLRLVRCALQATGADELGQQLRALLVRIFSQVTLPPAFLPTAPHPSRSSSFASADNVAYSIEKLTVFIKCPRLVFN
jgi:hypothetical protein